MCGIVGYIGGQNATPIILNGLRRLEYRGYDSAGIAVIEAGRIQVRREAGKLSKLSALVDAQPLRVPRRRAYLLGNPGEPTARNASLLAAPNVVLVHNGIVENYSNCALIWRLRVCNSTRIPIPRSLST